MTNSTQTIWLYNENCVRAGDICQEERLIEEESGDIHKVEGTEEELVALAREWMARPGWGYYHKRAASILQWFGVESL